MYFSEDILVFLTGQEEIESVVKSIRDISRDLPSGTHAISQFALASSFVQDHQLTHTVVFTVGQPGSRWYHGSVFSLATKFRQSF